MSARRLHVIAYDITEDAPRARLAKYLLDFGDRIQHSVFEADLDEDDIERILGRARQLIEDTDSVRLYPLCADCAARVRALGREGPLDAGDLIVV